MKPEEKKYDLKQPEIIINPSIREIGDPKREETVFNPDYDIHSDYVGIFSSESKLDN
jgi:hypothetical protein